MVQRTLVWMLMWLALTVALLAQQNQGELTAREIFYGTASSKKRAPAASSQSSSRNPKPQASPQTEANSSNQAAAQEILLPPTAPLGLRYSVLKRTPTGQFAEIDVNTAFRSGDGIRVSVESNDDAYLYIVNRGSSGTWSVLFPAPNINDGINRVNAHQRIEVPATGQFTFVDEPGEERLFVVLSRPPEADLERLITSLIRSDDTKGLAAHSINDEFVGRLRGQVIARDLIFEKFKGETEANVKEDAAYVVNLKDGASRVVADLSLRHQ